jgi:hypothetical protein
VPSRLTLLRRGQDAEFHRKDSKSAKLSELVGQGGLADFNIFNNGGISTAPSASGPLTIHDASGDALSLTSFAPVPEPATLSLPGLGGLAFLRRSRWRNQRPH